MISKSQEYKAEALRIAGFAMLSPFGRLFLQPVEIFRDYNLCLAICYIISTCAFGFLGLVFITRGYEIIEEKSTWKQ